MNDQPPSKIKGFAAEAVRYVHAALGVEVTFDSDTLPVLDHYLRNVPREQPATVSLVVATSGAYFGEVVRRELGGTWVANADEPNQWRMLMPSGLSFSPAGIVAAAIARNDDLEGVDPSLDVPQALRLLVETTLERMSDVSEEEYYSLCGRFDTLAHLQEVLLATRSLAYEDSSRN